MDPYATAQHLQHRPMDQSRVYAQWAVRRIGRAFALAIFGPVALLFAILYFVPVDQDSAELLHILGSAGIIVVAILSLCFARAPR